jgi:hypothetical protein
MLKEVGASGQISLGKKYAGQLFDMRYLEDGRVELTPVKVVLAVQEKSASHGGGDGWLTSERQARRKAAAARTVGQLEQARAQWEQENREAIDAMNKRMTGIGSMARRVHEWRGKNQADRNG